MAQSVVIGQGSGGSPSSSSNGSPQPSATVAPVNAPRAGQFIVTSASNPGVGATSAGANGSSPANIARVSASQTQSLQAQSWK